MESKSKKPTPEKCICGRPAILVKTKHGKMLSCPNPIRCDGNMRTLWQKSEDAAVVAWNSLVYSYAGEKKRHQE